MAKYELVLLRTKEENDTLTHDFKPIEVEARVLKKNTTLRLLGEQIASLAVNSGILDSPIFKDNGGIQRACLWWVDVDGNIATVDSFDYGDYLENSEKKLPKKPSNRVERLDVVAMSVFERLAEESKGLITEVEFDPGQSTFTL